MSDPVDPTRRSLSEAVRIASGKDVDAEAAIKAFNKGRAEAAAKGLRGCHDHTAPNAGTDATATDRPASPAPQSSAVSATVPIASRSADRTGMNDTGDVIDALIDVMREGKAAWDEGFTSSVEVARANYAMFEAWPALVTEIRRLRAVLVEERKLLDRIPWFLTKRVLGSTDAHVPESHERAAAQWLDDYHDARRARSDQ